MTEYRALGYSIPEKVMSYETIAGLLRFYAKENLSNTVREGFLLNNAAVILLRSSETNLQTTLWATMHPSNREPRTLIDILSDPRIEFFHYEPAKETPLEVWKKFERELST